MKNSLNFIIIFFQVSIQNSENFLKSLKSNSYYSNHYFTFFKISIEETIVSFLIKTIIYNESYIITHFQKNFKENPWSTFKEKIYE